MGRDRGRGRGRSVGVGRGGGRVGTKRGEISKDKAKENQRILSSQDDSRSRRPWLLPSPVASSFGDGDCLSTGSMDSEPSSSDLWSLLSPEDTDLLESEDELPTDSLESGDKLPTDSGESGDKLPEGIYLVEWGGKEYYSRVPQEQFTAWKQELEEFEKNPPGSEDPNFQKNQRDGMCSDFFSVIQKHKPEMVDYVLLKPLGLCGVYASGCWVHMNFIAKLKDAVDSPGVIFFAELDLAQDAVTCLTELEDIHILAGIKCCSLCHADEEEEVDDSFGLGFVYHPSSGFRFGAHRMLE